MREPTRRVILLGASNLTRAFPTVVETALRTWNEPLEIVAAMGHGRCFGLTSSVLGRKIPEIFSCELWAELDRRRELPTVALITDIGNDLLFGTAPDELIEMVDTLLKRLAERQAELIVTQLPTGSLDRMSSTRFQLFRRVMFPDSRLSFEAALDRARQTAGRLAQVTSRQKTTLFTVRDEWYGFDPIHIRRRCFARAWPEILATWQRADDALACVKTSLWRATYLRSLAPYDQSILGIRRQRSQPSGVLPDGTTVSLY